MSVYYYLVCRTCRRWVFCGRNMYLLTDSETLGHLERFLWNHQTTERQTHDIRFYNEHDRSDWLDTITDGWEDFCALQDQNESELEAPRGESDETAFSKSARD